MKDRWPSPASRLLCGFTIAMVAALIAPAAGQAGTISGAGSDHLAFAADSGQANDVRVRDLLIDQPSVSDHVEFHDVSGAPIADDGPGGCVQGVAANYAVCPFDRSAAKLFVEVDTRDGNDVLVNNLAGSKFITTLIGGDGNDRLDGGNHIDYLIGCNGNDSLRGGGGSDYLAGDDGQGRCANSSGNDTLDGQGNNDQLIGGPGRDTASWADALEPVQVRLDGVANDGGRSDEPATGLIVRDNVASDVENITTGQGNDKLYGNEQSNVLKGGYGDDKLYGRNGDDTLDGGAGSDRINGQSGNDTVDYMFEFGAIVDLVHHVERPGNPANPDRDRLGSIENVNGSQYDDTITGNSAINRIDGRTGNDTIRGGAGNDVTIGSEGNDGLYGEAGTDLMIGGTGSDVLYDHSPERDLFLDGAVWPFGVLDGGDDLIDSRDGLSETVDCGVNDTSDIVFGDPDEQLKNC